LSLETYLKNLNLKQRSRRIK